MSLESEGFPLSSCLEELFLRSVKVKFSDYIAWGALRLAWGKCSVDSAHFQVFNGDGRSEE